MCRNVANKILWVRFKPDQDYAKKVKVRAANKRPQGLSIRDFCPGVALDHKKAINKALKAKKTARPSFRWRVDIRNDDFVVFSWNDNEAQWTQEDLDNFGDLPAIKWANFKRPRSSPGEQQGDGPPQPPGGLSPQGEDRGDASGGGVGAAQGGEGEATGGGGGGGAQGSGALVSRAQGAAAIPGLGAAGGGMPRVPSLANLFDKK